MRTTLLAVLLLMTSASIARADDAMDVQVGVATVHGGGLGASLELGGGPTTFVAGAGAALGFGYSSVEGWIGHVAPGLGLGVRRYLGGWYLGPTVGGNHLVWSSREEMSGTDGDEGWTVWGAVDVGRRWHLGTDRDWMLTLGLSGGVARREHSSDAVPLIGLTFTVGR